MEVTLLSFKPQEFDLEDIPVLPSNISFRHITTSRQNHWDCITDIIRDAEASNVEQVILCTDIRLIKNMDWTSFCIYLKTASNLGSKIFITDAQKVECLLPVHENFFWIDHFVESNLIIIYRSGFQLILDNNDSSETVEQRLSNVTSNKLLLYPMLLNPPISVAVTDLNDRMDRLHNQYKKKNR